MSTFGNLLKILAIGAFFVATGPFGLSVGSTLATALRIGGVVLGYLGALVDRPHLLYERQRYDMALEPGTPLPVVYGRAKVPGIVADWFVDTDTADKVLYMVVPFAHGSRDGLGIKEVEEIWFNNRLAVTVTGDVRAHPYQTDSVDYKIAMGTTVQNIGNTQLTGLPSAVTDKALFQVTDSGWNITTDTGHGIACVIFRFLNVVKFGVGEGGSIDPDTRGPAFRGPPSVSFIVQGNRVYDHRTDMWTPAGDNPAMCIRDYLLSEIYGCGFSPTMIHEDSFDDAADYCDVVTNPYVGAELIATSSVANPTVITTVNPHDYTTGDTVFISGHAGSSPALVGNYTATVTGDSTFTIPENVTVGGSGGVVARVDTVKRFTCNGVVDTSRATAENIQELLSSCRGNLVWEQGQFKLSIRSDAATAPTLLLSPSNIIGEWSFRNAGLEEKWNIVQATYIEPANGEFKAQEVQWPPVDVTNAYLTADNEFTNRLGLALPFTNDQVMAQAIAQITLNEARLGITCQVRCTEEALAVSVGDLVEVTHPTPGWTAKDFWVTAMQLLPDTTVALSLQEYDATAYDLDTMEDRRSFPATEHDSIFVVPEPGVVTAEGISGGGLRVSWISAGYGLIDFYDVQAKCTSCGDEYVTIAHVREGGLLEAVATLARAGQTWHARVRVINIVGWPSEWVESSATDIPAVSGITPGVGMLIYTGYAPTVVPTTGPPDLTAVDRNDTGGNACISGATWRHVIEWTVTGPDDVNHRVDIDVASDAAGVTYVSLITDLTTSSDDYSHNTGLNGYQGGDPPTTTYYRKYKVKIVRRSDLAVIEEMETTQGTMVITKNCP